MFHARLQATYVQPFCCEWAAVIAHGLKCGHAVVDNFSRQDTILRDIEYILLTFLFFVSERLANTS